MTIATGSPAIAVLGAGGIGGLLAAVLARGGNGVVVLASDRTSHALADVGMRIESERFGTFHIPLPAATLLKTTVSACLIAVKSPHLESALERVPSDVLGDGLIIPFLNGIDHVDALRHVYAAASVAPATIRTELVRTATGVVRQTSPFALVEIAASGTNWARVESIADRLKATGFDVRVRDDEVTMLWEKLCFIAPVALMTTSKRVAVGGIRTRWRAETLAVIAEVAAVAEAEGAAVDPEAVARFLDSVPEAMESSMQRDQALGRVLEIDAIGGSVVRRAARVGVRVPVTSQLVDELRTRSGAVRASGGVTTGSLHTSARDLL